MGNEMADYLAKKGTKISQTSVCKLTFHSAKLKIKRGIQLTSQNTTSFKPSINTEAK
jgi:hypothetical protein